ncbi:MAG: DUF1192 domain-containing protein [Pseudomonadota bacterium]
MFEEEPVSKPQASIIPGEDLSRFSVNELKARVADLESELKRARAMIDEKEAGLDAAQALFKG